MKTCLIASALLLGLLLNAHAQTTNPNSTTTATAAYKLTVVFSNLNTRSGKLYIGLANDAASFSGESFRKTRIDVPASGEVSVNFADLPAGRYALRVYQDLNDNQQMDREGGMPSEPFGFSTVTRLMGPPDFGQCAFDLAGDKSVTVSMISL